MFCDAHFFFSFSLVFFFAKKFRPRWCEPRTTTRCRARASCPPEVSGTCTTSRGRAKTGSCCLRRCKCVCVRVCRVYRVCASVSVCVCVPVCVSVHRMSMCTSMSMCVLCAPEADNSPQLSKFSACDGFMDVRFILRVDFSCFVVMWCSPMMPLFPFASDCKTCNGGALFFFFLVDAVFDELFALGDIVW